MPSFLYFVAKDRPFADPEPEPPAPEPDAPERPYRLLEALRRRPERRLRARTAASPATHAR